jgi:hypothetical protein
LSTAQRRCTPIKDDPRDIDALFRKGFFPVVDSDDFGDFSTPFVSILSGNIAKA